MYEIKLPFNTLVIAGRQRTGKSVAVRFLADQLEELRKEKVLVITDRPKEHTDFTCNDCINLYAFEWEPRIYLPDYSTIIFDVNAIYKGVTEDEMILSLYREPCNLAKHFIDKLNKLIDKPFVVITAHFENQIERAQYELKPVVKGS